MLAYEKLDVYRAALELRGVVRKLKKGSRDLKDQIDRATSSVVLNIAEGAGRWQSGDKRRFYEIAKGSAMESGAVLDCLATDGTIVATEHEAAKELVTRVVQMLSKLCQRT